MRCPKCGYNSFEYNDACFKCTNDLQAFKETHGLKPIVIPKQARKVMSDELIASRKKEQSPQKPAGAPGDVFAFGMQGTPGDQTGAKDNPFDFDDDMLTSKPKGFDDFNFDTPTPDKQSSDVEADFANLLEQTAHAPAGQPSDSGTATGSQKTDEFNLNDFSWDDTPSPKAEEPKKPSDDFSSLFGSPEKK